MSSEEYPPRVNFTQVKTPPASPSPPIIEGSRIQDYPVCIKALVYPKPAVKDDYKGPRFRPCEYPIVCRNLVGTKVLTVDTKIEVGVVIEAYQTPVGSIEAVVRLRVPKEAIVDYCGLAFKVLMGSLGQQPTDQIVHFTDVGLVLDKTFGDWSEISTEFSYV